MYLPKIWLICRICLKQNYGMLNLYTTHCNLPIWSVLRDVGGIPVRKDDNLSDKICEKCFDRLWKAHGFRLDCQRAHREITQVVQYGRKKLLEFLPEVAVVDAARLIDISQEPEVQDFQSASSSSSCSTNNDLNNHKPEPQAASQPHDNKINAKHEPMANEDDNLLAEDSSNLKIPEVELEKIDQQKTVKAIRKEKTSSKTQRQTTSKSTKRQNIKDISKGILKGAANHSMSSTSRISCNICTKIFSSKTILKQHMYTHTKSNMCRLCGKIFTHKRHIRDHLNTHYGVRPYSCRLCPSRFADISNRNKHERCLVCNLKFNTVVELRNHLNLHLKPVFKEETD